MARSTKKEQTETETEVQTDSPTPTSSSQEDQQPEIIDVALDESGGAPQPTPEVTVDDDGIIQIA